MDHLAIIYNVWVVITILAIFGKYSRSALDKSEYNEYNEYSQLSLGGSGYNEPISSSQAVVLLNILENHEEKISYLENFISLCQTSVDTGENIIIF